MVDCDSKHEYRDITLGCTKRKGHKGYHKSGFHAW